MLNRRLVLASSFALLGGCAARAVAPPTATQPPASEDGDAAGAAPPVTPSGPALTVGPHANWNGTAGSGSVAPTDPVRTGPKAIGRIMTCPGQRVSSQLLLKIPCDAYGGIKQVNLSGDCAATTITGMSLVDFVDVNGVNHKEFYHAVYLDTAAFVAKGGTAGSRQANIYAEIVPNNAAVQKRVVSFFFYPEATATDGTYNVGAGQPYATIRAALGQARLDSRQAPLIQIKTTGFYEMEDSTWGIAAGGKGFAVITHDPGVVATIRRAAPFSPTNQAAWKWTPGWDGIEFRGSGIVIDIRNTTQVVMNAKPCLFNGCKITNSVGTRDSLYWNKSPHPGWAASTPSWYQYHRFEYGGSPACYQLAAIGGTSTGVFGDVYTHTPIVYGCHDEAVSAEWYRQPLQAMTVRYNGAGTGTLAKTGGNGSGWLVLTDAAGTLNIDLGSISKLVDISTVVATINARSGWTAVARDTTRAARFLIGSNFGNTNGFPATDAKSADLSLTTLIDIHGDGTQTYGGVENYVYWNWVLDGGDVYLSAVLFFDGDGSPNGDRDMSFVNCVLLADQSGVIGLGGSGAHHKLFHHITSNLWVTPNAGTQEVYTEMTNCIVNGIGGGTTAQPVHFYNNLFTVPVGGTAPSGATFTGNVSLGSARTVTPTDFLADPSTENFAPKGTALTTLYPSVFPYDQRGVLRSASDAAGAWSKNAA
jgi:hypothetical protein